VIEVIKPSEFKVIPWKNGKGETIELAISAGGTITDFDWRLSIASVDENGAFSNFSGYFRHLALIKGAGIELVHNNMTCDSLSALLSIAKFDGSCKTYATLHAGPISDFNLMTKNHYFDGKLKTFKACKKTSLDSKELVFIYGLSNSTVLVEKDKKTLCKLPAGHLLKLFGETGQSLKITGKNIIYATVERL
jgi:hypothetical protein